MKNQHAEKVKSKDKSENVDKHAQGMALNDLEECVETSESKYVATFKWIIDFFASAKYQNYLNQILYLKKWKAYLALVHTVLVTSVDWIF